MNKEVLTGNVSKITGKIKEETGKLIEDESLQTEGKVQYLSGSLLEYYGQKKSEMYKKINGFLNNFSKSEK